MALEYASKLRDMVHGILKGCEKNASEPPPVEMYICSYCGKKIHEDHVYIKTKRRSELYILTYFNIAKLRNTRIIVCVQKKGELV